MLKKIWKWFWRPSTRYTWGAIFIIGGIVGVVATGSFVGYVKYTNTLGFCISCHEMRDNVYPEYKESIHYKNPKGVRAVCSDCHVPKDWGPKLARKVSATKELFHKLRGTISTREKFQAERLTLAKKVWATMEANDSKECRNCHAFDAMDLENQRPVAKQAHAYAKESGGTCIDCHKGIAHKLPEGY